MIVLLWVKAMLGCTDRGCLWVEELLLVPESSETSSVSKQPLQRLWIWACREPQQCEKVQISSITREILLKCQDYLSFPVTNPVRYRG